MKILLLSPHHHLIDYFKSIGDEVYQTMDKIDAEFVKGFDYIVSYGYRHIISKEVLDLVPAINLHMSYLPWNRGADPNYWSWVDNTPKGFTIHKIDTGLDTGDILFQKEVFLDENTETLITSYAKIKEQMEASFKSLWSIINKNIIIGMPQDRSAGSYHRSIERPELKQGWNTQVKKLIKRS